jgi:hypothetical protein
MPNDCLCKPNFHACIVCMFFCVTLLVSLVLCTNLVVYDMMQKLFKSLIFHACICVRVFVCVTLLVSIVLGANLVGYDMVQELSKSMNKKSKKLRHESEDSKSYDWWVATMLMTSFTCSYLNLK